jgi:hypothetical protein
MRARFLISSAIFCVSALALATVKDLWERGRIVEVRKSVESKPLYWIANTPVTKDETSYKLTIHLGQKLLVGFYALDKSHAAPPDEWVRGWPVEVRLDNNDMYLKALNGGGIKLRIVKRTAAEALEPVSDAEMKKAYAPPEPSEQQTGLADSDSKNTSVKAKPADSETKEGSDSSAEPVRTIPETPVGMIDVTTVPYLAQIYIDGTSRGYSPAKFRLSAGKHVLRAEKNGYQPWSREITVLERSESAVFAELKKK